MIGNYFKTAVKVLMRRKFFTFANLFGIAFTLIVLMVVTSMLDQYANPGGPERDSRRHLDIDFVAVQSPDRNSVVHTGPGYRFLDENVRKLKTPVDMTFYTDAEDATSFQTGERRELGQRYTDAAYWSVFHFEFLEGAPFSESDDADGNLVAVISLDVRDEMFPGATGIGETLEVDGRPVRVIGVVDNVSSLLQRAHAEVWMPIGAIASPLFREQLWGGFNGTLVVASTADIEPARDEFKAMLPNVFFPDPENWNTLFSFADTRLQHAARGLVGEQDDPDANLAAFFAIIFGASLLFMLLPTINMVNLNVSRILERSSEIGVRKSFGASSRALIGQFLFENLILTAVGGVLGLGGALLLLNSLAASGLVPHAEFGLNVRIFLAALGLITVFGLLSGVYPAWRMSRLHPVDALRGRV